MTILCDAIRIQYTYGMLFKKPHNKPLINLDRLVITGKYQTSVFHVWTSPYGLGPYCQNLSLIFSRNDHTLLVNKKLVLLKNTSVELTQQFASPIIRGNQRSAKLHSSQTRLRGGKTFYYTFMHNFVTLFPAFCQPQF